jgi:hypothetical protein
MSKIFKALNWYTFEQAAKRLSVTLGAEVSTADVVQLVVDEKLPLYWFLNMKVGCYPADLFSDDMMKKEIEERKKSFFSSCEPLEGPHLLRLSENPFIRNRLLSDNFKQGDEALEPLRPVIIEDKECKRWHVMGISKVSEHEALPPDAIIQTQLEPDYGALVLMADDLTAFEDSLKDEPERRQNALTKENVSLSILAYVMAALKYGFDPTKQRSNIPQTIADDLYKRYGDIGLTDDTVRKYLRLGAERIKNKEYKEP